MPYTTYGGGSKIKTNMDLNAPADSRPSRTVRYLAWPVTPKRENDVLQEPGPAPARRAISRPRAGTEWPLRNDWSPRILQYQVKRIWRVSVFMVFLLLLATSVHIVQLFVPPANFGGSCQRQNNILQKGAGLQQGRFISQTCLHCETYVSREIV